MKLGVSMIIESFQDALHVLHAGHFFAHGCRGAGAESRDGTIPGRAWMVESSNFDQFRTNDIEL